MQTSTILAAFLSFILTSSMYAAEADTATPATEPAVSDTTASDAAATAENQSQQPQYRYRSERAMIHWHDGLQQMVVSPRLSRETTAPWILPLKGSIEQIQFRLAEPIPQGWGFGRGYDCRHIAEQRLNNLNYAVIAGQLWTIPMCYFGIDRAQYGASAEMPTDADSEGVHMKILAADSAASLAKQLQDMGLPLGDIDPEAYANYYTPDYSLLVVWADPLPEPAVQPSEETDTENAQRERQRSFYRRRPSVYVEFPTDKPYYPMTHRGEQQGRLSLTLTGYWQAAGQEDIQVEQFDQRIVQQPSIPEVFKLAPAQKNIPLTTLSFGRSGNLIQADLTFIPGQTKKLGFVDVVSKLPYPALAAAGFVVLAVISYLAAGISGLISFGKWKGYAAFGLWNVFTLIAVGLAIKFSTAGIGQTLRQNTWKTRLFLVLFSLLVVGLSFAVFAAIKLPLKPY